ncbi:MAG: ATPase [Rhodobacterales bacterium]|nr:MAG: ATPase [Rhodobacterales bacterium]
MIYASASDWRAAPHKRIALFGMSGLGKTHLAKMLRESGDWYHYNVDYRIGTRYMGEAITDNAKRLAMQVPLLRELLMSDSIYIGSNISFDNLTPLSTYLGKPGAPAKGGLPIDEYRRRQDQHRQAEIAALLDTGHFIERAEQLYDYGHFLCDTGGSICEVVDPADPDDPVLHHLARRLLLVWIEGSDAHTDNLIARFDKAPKPMYYHPDFLATCWREYLSDNNVKPDDVDPDHFIRATYARALHHRQPLYEGMARWGIKVAAEDVARITCPQEFDDLIAAALPQE